MHSIFCIAFSFAAHKRREKKLREPSAGFVEWDVRMLITHDDEASEGEEKKVGKFFSFARLILFSALSHSSAQSHDELIGGEKSFFSGKKSEAFN